MSGMLLKKSLFSKRVTMTTERPSHPEIWLDFSMEKSAGTHPAYWELSSASFGKSPGLLSGASRSLKFINIHWWSRLYSLTVWLDQQTLTDLQAYARHSDVFRESSEELTGPLWWQVSHVGADLWVAQILLRDLGPEQRTLVKNHDVMVCTGWFWPTRGFLSEGGGKPAQSLNFIQTQPPSCWITLDMSFNLSSHYFYPLHEMELCFLPLHPH